MRTPPKLTPAALQSHPTSLGEGRAVDSDFVAAYGLGRVIAHGDEYLPYTGLVIVLINSFNLF